MNVHRAWSGEQREVTKQIDNNCHDTWGTYHLIWKHCALFCNGFQIELYVSSLWCAMDFQICFLPFGGHATSHSCHTTRCSTHLHSHLRKCFAMFCGHWTQPSYLWFRLYTLLYFSFWHCLQIDVAWWHLARSSSGLQKVMYFMSLLRKDNSPLWRQGELMWLKWGRVFVSIQAFIGH